ncbi:MAG: DNA polymerase III subunit gamma/tau [Flavobacteriales bacterium]
MAENRSEFIVSARKYRPSNWPEVVGQEAITETLQNSIEQGHLAHAYLFCGPRGVGKTTCARIFAKEINKSAKHQDEDFAFNIFELDAASNNKVEDIRNLNDQVRIPPQVGDYKVYIIDEVHMLSSSAFNAFLKTLEEPPKHAIFILATTEKHKIIPTILSRCQIYDFNRITVEEIVKHLRSIATQEKIEAEDDALHVIAQKADGALRDALSIFDQLASFTNRKLTYEAVLKNLHVLDYDYYFKLVNQLSKADYSSALVLLDEVLKLGFDANHFISGLGSHLRDLLVCQEPKTISLLEVGDSVKKQYLEQAQSMNASWLLAALKESQQAEFRIKTSMNQRLLLEVTLLSIASLEAEKKNTSPQLDSAPKTHITEPKKPIIKEREAEPRIKPQPQAETSLITEPTKEETKARATQVEEPKVAPIQSDSDSSQRKKRRPTTISLNIDSDHTSDANTKSVSEILESKSEIISLEDAWGKVCENHLEEGHSALHAILKRQNLDEIYKGDSLTVNLMHGVEEEEFGLHRTDVLEALRNLTGNRSLQLSTEFTEQTTETKLFGTKDKFEHLAKKNPALIKLKKDLDLDFL